MTPSPPSCSRCHAPVSPSDRFCPSCGAPLAATTPAAPASGAPPVDIRERVDQDRGMIKRLQLLVPGYRGYRQGEDIREADSILRLQIADQVHRANGVATQRRQALAQAGQFAALNDLALAIADLNRIEGQIRHAEQGYTGISPAVRLDPARLDRLYEYDYGFAQAADALEQSLGPLSTPNADPAAVTTAVANVREMVSRLDRAFQARVQVIEATKVP